MPEHVRGVAPLPSDAVLALLLVAGNVETYSLTMAALHLEDILLGAMTAQDHYPDVAHDPLSAVAGVLTAKDPEISLLLLVLQSVNE